MLKSILGCSAIAAGLWAGRLIVPAALAIPADVVGFVVICAMFVWLVRRAQQNGERRGSVSALQRIRERLIEEEQISLDLQATNQRRSEAGDAMLPARRH